MDDWNALAWKALNSFGWWWWGINAGAAWVSLCFMGRLAAPRSRLGLFLRYTTTAGYWLVIVSPLLNVGQPLAFPILTLSWMGILYQMWQDCRLKRPRDVRRGWTEKIVASMVEKA